MQRALSRGARLRTQSGTQSGAQSGTQPRAERLVKLSSLNKSQRASMARPPGGGWNSFHYDTLPPHK